MSDAPPLTLGTAGHIDHGKTALVGALTGVDTDRLPQERARGISIELGYARMALPSGRTLSVIDVPGHERFVRTMVAGATGVDLYLMTIAADDGVMPQTREHAAVLRALALTTGVVAVTKSDLADPSPAADEAAALLGGDVAVVAVSARTGAGLHELRTALDAAAAQVRSRALDDVPARLHVDRIFTIRGAGTVVTGTLWSGTVARGDALRLLPAGTAVRVRAVQVHDAPVERAQAGQRVALNLVGVARDAIARGDVLVDPAAELHATHRLDCELELDHDREPETGARATVHHGTRESPARLAWLGGRFWQLRLEQPLVAAAGDRVVVRQIAPPDTLGGGRVLDPEPQRHGPGRETLAKLSALARGEPVPTSSKLLAYGAKSSDEAPGGESARRGPEPELGPEALALEARLRDAGIEPPPDSELDRAHLDALRTAGRAVRLTRNLHMHPDAVLAARTRLVELAQANDRALTLAQARDALNTSRKYAQALLEHLDSERVFIRRGDEHVLRRAAHRG